MMGAVLCFPSTARLLRRRPNTKDVSSRRVALRNRLPIPDLQPPPPGRRRLRSAMLINPSASSPPPPLPSISAKLSSRAFSCQPAILPIAHRGFRPPPLCPRRHFSRSVETPPPAGQRVFCSHALIQNSHFSRTR